VNELNSSFAADHTVARVSAINSTQATKVFCTEI